MPMAPDRKIKQPSSDRQAERESGDSPKPHGDKLENAVHKAAETGGKPKP
jgi:hypothetical protein